MTKEEYIKICKALFQSFNGTMNGKPYIDLGKAFSIIGVSCDEVISFHMDENDKGYVLNFRMDKKND